MRKLLFLLVPAFFTASTYANNIEAAKDSTIEYSLPDTVKAIALIADVSVQSMGKKESFAGIKLQNIQLVLEADKDEKEISFQFPASAVVVSTGLHVEKEKTELEWNYNWTLNTTYKLLIASASDSAGNFTLYSGYIFLPAEGKWKLIGTCKINGVNAIKEPAAIVSNGNKSKAVASFNKVWCQRESGSWKRLDDQPQNFAAPRINSLPNIDSVQQYEADKQIIEQAVALHKTDPLQIVNGVYYKIINAGTGKSFSVADSITVHYQLRIFGTPEVISGDDTSSYTFALKDLIKAWQIAVPLVKTGGKIKLVIPSGLAYSIRTRAATIPPNSILEFTVDVLDAKPLSK